MTDEAMLAIFKTSLKITPSNTAYDDMLSLMLASAKESIIREGASTLSPETAQADAELVIRYGLYLYAERNGEQTRMPEGLRTALNNRVFSDKMR